LTNYRIPDVKVADLPTLEFLSGILDTSAAGDRGSAGLSAGLDQGAGGIQGSRTIRRRRSRAS